MATAAILPPIDAGRAFRGPLWMGWWVAFAVFHAALMGLDWRLRDHRARIQPMPGGLPDWFSAPLLILSFVAFGAALYCALPSNWPTWKKSLLTVLQIAIALPLLAWAELNYVVSNGIDTL
jgi:hypothetical protein